jgi:hypothetical protein
MDLEFYKIFVELMAETERKGEKWRRRGDRNSDFY